MISKIISEENIVKARDLIYDSNKIVIVAHSSPDGDAVGSSLGLYHFFFSINKETTVVYPDPFPACLNWLHGADKALIYSQQKEEVENHFNEADLIICVDFNEPKRIGKMKDLLINCSAKKILIDHHPHHAEGLWDVTISHPEVSSTSEITFRLICRMGYAADINKNAAEAFYTGMMTDTGTFTFNSNNTEIYQIIGELIRKGINKDEIYNKVYNTYTADRMRLMGYVLANKMRIYPEYQAALISLSLEEQKKYNFQIGDSEGFVNLPLSILGVRFSAFLKESDERIKISLRSQGSFAVNEVSAKYFNGGGHTNAAGGESHLSLEETEKLFEQILPEYKDLLDKE
jgi:phosphoesterase RecJ-like protein